MDVCPCLSPELSQKHSWICFPLTYSELVFTYSQVDPPNTGLPHCILSEPFSHISHFNSPIPRCYKPQPLSTKTPGRNPSSLLSLACSLLTVQFRKSFTHRNVPYNCFFSMKLSLEPLPVCTTPSVPLQAISLTYAQHLLLSYLVISIPHQHES